MAAFVNLNQTHIRLSSLGLKDPWSGFLLHLSGFPTAEAELIPAREFVRNVAALLVKREGGFVETFVQFTQLHLGDGAKRLSSRGREWLPRMGLGVWPDRDPPHSWSIEELRDILPGEKVRPLMDIALRVTAPAKQDEARDAMLGIGTVLQFIVPDREGFIKAARDLLLPPITDPSYTSFAFYVPLLQGASIRNATAGQLESWMCGARAFLRESPEDEGILLVARGPMDDIVLQSGAIRTSSQDEWSVPVDNASVRSHSSYRE